ncbi:polyprotein [Soybean latent spherical virus]|uniref:Polyprotein n=1 Tax=Soybean latent spherical virus TaxID=1927714 RepID=A0A1L5JIY1_9SECO|nr:polyprotein [Soybean latent spherical virus]APO15118.1 polyprotein [Soybean latent spherical virus]
MVWSPDKVLSLHAQIRASFAQKNSFSSTVVVSPLPEGDNAISTAVLSPVVPATGALNALREKLSAEGVVPSKVVLPIVGPSYAARRATVLLGLVERAMKLASTIVYRTLFQRRSGRKVYALEPWRVPFARLLGIVVAMRMENAPVAGPVDREVKLLEEPVEGPVDHQFVDMFPHINNYFLFYEEEEQERVTPSLEERYGKFRPITPMLGPMKWTYERKELLPPPSTIEDLCTLHGAFLSMIQAWIHMESQGIDSLEEYYADDGWETSSDQDYEEDEEDEEEEECVVAHDEYYATAFCGPFNNPQQYAYAIGPFKPNRMSRESFSPILSLIDTIFPQIKEDDFIFRVSVEKRIPNWGPFHGLPKTIPYHFSRGEENYFFPARPKVIYHEWELRNFEKCPWLHHQMMACDGFRFVDRFFVFQCYWCSFEALKHQGKVEQAVRAHRIAHFNKQFEEPPPAEIKKGGPSGTIAQVGMVFGGKAITTIRNTVEFATCKYVNAHSGREDEEMRSNLHDRASSEIAEHGAPTISNAIEVLRTRKRSKNNKTLVHGEGRFGDENTHITEKDVFEKVVHNNMSRRVLSKLGAPDPKILTQNTFPTLHETVFMPQNRKKCIYSPLPVFKEDELRALLDKHEMKSSGITAIDLAIQSHIPEGHPAVAFCTVMDGDCGNPNLAALSGSKFDLGRDRCQVITLPLVNVNLNYALNQLNLDNDVRLYLATLLNEGVDKLVGRPVFSYGTSILLEHRRDALTNQTLCKDDWLEIEKRNVQKGNRILEGFNVEQHIAQDYNQELAPFAPDLKLECRPNVVAEGATHAFSAKGIVKNSLNSRLGRSMSVQFLNDIGSSSRRTEFRPPVVQDFGGIAAGFANHTEGSTSKFEAPRYTNAQSGLENPYVVAVTKPFAVKKDAKEGTLITSLDFYNLIKQQHRSPFYDWAAKGLIDPEIVIKTYAGSNQFVGTTIAIAHDFFSRVDVQGKLGGKMSRVIGNCLPQTLHPLSEGAIGTHNVNIEKYVGHSFYFNSPTFADPQFHVYIYSTNAVEMESDWQLTIEILIRKRESEMSASLTPILTVPQNPSAYVDLDLYKGFGEIKLASRPQEVMIAMDIAESRAYSDSHYCLGLPQAMFRTMQGSSGILHGRLRRVGSCLVSCVARLVMWWGSDPPTLAETSMYPFVDIDFQVSDGEFSLKIQSAFARFPNRERKAWLVVYPLGGPLAAKGVGTSFQFAIYLKGIEVSEPMPPVLLPDHEYVWMQVNPPNQGEFTFDLPNHICDVKVSGATTLLRENPLACIFGACGFFAGTLTMTVGWSNRGGISTKESTLWFGKCYGDRVGTREILDHCTFNAHQAGSCSYALEVGDFSGFQIPGSTGNKHQYISVWMENAGSVSHFRISVRLHRGFSFYGRSCLPIK